MKLTQVMLVVLLAAISYGGSFSCSGSTHDDDDDLPKPAGVQ